MRNGELVQVPAGTKWDEVPDPRVDVAEEAILRVEVARVRRELTGLPEPERAAVELSFGLNGFGRPLSTREIGDQLGCSKVTAWRWRRRGLELLRQVHGVEETEEEATVEGGDVEEA